MESKRCQNKVTKLVQMRLKVSLCMVHKALNLVWIFWVGPVWVTFQYQLGLIDSKTACRFHFLIEKTHRESYVSCTRTQYNDLARLKMGSLNQQSSLLTVRPLYLLLVLMGKGFNHINTGVQNFSSRGSVSSAQVIQQLHVVWLKN